MRADDGSVDHLHGRAVRTSQRIHNLAPDGRPLPPDEAIVAGDVRPKMSGKSRHGAPDRGTQKMQLSTRRSCTRGMPRGLFGSGICPELR